MTRGKYNGRLVIPCDHREQKNGKGIKLSHVFYSDDHGRTWQLGGTVNDHTDECQVVELHDGRLMINMRNYWGTEGGKKDLGGKRAIAVSSDGGESWSEFWHDEALVEPICQASFVKLADDVFRQAPLLFSNPASTSGRVRLTVRRSDDQGKTWPVERVIHTGPSAYSCLSILPDRSIGLLYEGGEKQAYEKLIFARFTLPWLSNGRP
jgi:sialidase-1